MFWFMSTVVGLPVEDETISRFFMKKGIGWERSFPLTKVTTEIIQGGRR